MINIIGIFTHLFFILFMVVWLFEDKEIKSYNRKKWEDIQI
jgi:hypothetical protein